MTVTNFLTHFQSISVKEFPVLQEKAIAHFNRMGFPTSKNEEWKYTPITPILSKEFSFSVPQSRITKEEIVERFPFVKN